MFTLIKLIISFFAMRRSLWSEIFLLVTIKLILLSTLWTFCFSHPLDKTLSSTDVATHLTQINSNLSHYDKP